MKIKVTNKILFGIGFTEGKEYDVTYVSSSYVQVVDDFGEITRLFNHEFERIV